MYKKASVDNWMDESDRSYGRFSKYYNKYIDRQKAHGRALKATLPSAGAAALFGLLDGPVGAASSALLAAAITGKEYIDLQDQEAAKYALEKLHMNIPDELKGINTYYY